MGRTGGREAMQQQSVSVVKDYGSRAQRVLFEEPAPG